MKKVYLFVIALCAIIFANAQGIKPEKGSGIQKDPYLISNLDNLLWITSDKEYIGGNKYFKQMVDIDASSIFSWTPIGTELVAFNGNYDGNGHTINSLRIDATNLSYIGVFGYTVDATISNLGVIDVKISGLADVGAIAGYAKNTSISNCFSTGLIISSKSDCGGLVGYLTEEKSQITQSYSIAEVQGVENVGGLVGNASNFAKITNSYARSSITSNKMLVGGIVGLLGLNSTVESCYSASQVIGTYSDGIAFTGFQNGGTVNDSYWDSSILGNLMSSNGTGIPSNQFFSSKTFTNWDFIKNPSYNVDGIWAIASEINSSYPCLAWQVRPRVTNDTAIAITDTSATISASVFASSLEGKASILFGSTDAFQISAPILTIYLTASKNTVLSQTVTKLQPNTEYYYTIAITNSAGTFRILTKSFTTRPSAPTVQDISYCVDETAKQLTATGTNLKWYFSETAATPLQAAPTPQTTTAGSTVYWVSQTLTPGGESARAKLTVRVNANPTLEISPSKTEICSGDTLTLIAKGANSYTWDIDQKDSIISKSKNNDTVLFNPSYNQTITLTGSTNACSSTIKKTITVFESRLLNGYDSILQPSCNISTGAVYFSKLPSVYYWSILSKGQVFSSNNTQITVVYNLPANTTYYFRFKTNYGCISRDSVEVTIKPAPVTPSAPKVSDTVYCQKQKVNPLRVKSGINIKWYETKNSIKSSVIAPTPSTASVGTQTFWLADSADCVSERIPLKVTVNPLPVVSITDTVIRLGKSLVLNYGSPSKGTYTINNTQYTLFEPKFSGTSTLVLHYTDANKCSNSDSAKIKVIPAEITQKPIAPITLSLGATSKTYLFDSLFTDSLPLQYSVVSDNNAVLSPATTARGFGLIAYTSGTANITITATASDGTKSVISCAVQVTGKPIDNCTVAISGTITRNKCFADQTAAIDVTVSGGTKPYYYKWSNTSSAEDLNALSAGEYSLVVRDTLGCVATKSFTLSPPTPLQLSVDVKQASCGMADGSIALTTSGGTAPYALKWNDASTQSSKTALAAGVYSITLSDANACSLVQQIELSNIAAPRISVDSIRASTCGKAEGGAWLHATGGSPIYSYRWNDASTDSIRTRLAPGNYQVTLTDAANCLATAAIVVKSLQFAQPSISLVTVSKITKTNLVVWLRESTEQIDYYTVYRQNTKGLYDSIGFRSHDSVSVFVDPTADPAKHAWRYKISASNHCKQESALSNEYKTMRVRVNRGLGSTVNIDWDSYEGTGYATYYIYRNTKNKKDELIDSVPANVYDYSDINAPADVESYYVAVDLPFEINPLLFKSDTGPFSQSLSNMSEASLVSEREITSFENNAQLVVYPNPANDLLSIQLSNASIVGDVQILASDAVSYSILPAATNNELRSVSINHLASGIYSLAVPTDKGTLYQKLVIIK